MGHEPAPTDESQRQGRDGTTDTSVEPYVGPPVHATAVDKATPLQVGVSVSQDPVIALAGKQIIRPFDPMWDHFRQPQLKFRVAVKSASFRVAVTIYKSGGATLSKDKFERTEICNAGDHDYAWDVYDDNAVLDTTVLRAGPLTAGIYTDDGHDVHVSKRIDLATAPSLAKWADTKIDLRAKTIEITTYVSFSNSTIGSVSAANFAAVSGHIKDGIEQYWKGQIRVNHMPWTVTTKVVERAADSVPFTIQQMAPKIIRDNLKIGKRCFNAGTIVPGAPIIYYIDESKALNAKSIKETGAHEFGHSILRDAIDSSTSATHKGTSSTLGTLVDGAPEYPMSGDIDLMRYYADWPAGTPGTTNGYPDDYWSRLVAIEDDLKRFASVARVEISTP